MAVAGQKDIARLMAGRAGSDRKWGISFEEANLIRLRPLPTRSLVHTRNMSFRRRCPWPSLRSSQHSQHSQSTTLRHRRRLPLAAHRVTRRRRGDGYNPSFRHRRAFDRHITTERSRGSVADERDPCCSLETIRTIRSAPGLTWATRRRSLEIARIGAGLSTTVEMGAVEDVCERTAALEEQGWDGTAGDGGALEPYSAHGKASALRAVTVPVDVRSVSTSFCPSFAARQFIACHRPAIFPRPRPRPYLRSCIPQLSSVLPCRYRRLEG